MPAFSKLNSILLWTFSLLVALVSWRFMVFGVDVSMPAMVHHLDGAKLAFYIHIICAPIALAILPFQLSPKLRKTRLGLHRWLGRVYGVAILLAGVAGLIIAPDAATGAVAGLGFFLLSAAWLVTTGLAIWHAIGRRVVQHRQWIIRSAALTLAAVTLRIEMPLLIWGFGFETGYQSVAWLCWVPNLVLAEWYLRRQPWGVAA